MRLWFFLIQLIIQRDQDPLVFIIGVTITVFIQVLKTICWKVTPLWSESAYNRVLATYRMQIAHFLLASWCKLTHTMEWYVRKEKDILRVEEPLQSKNWNCVTREHFYNVRLSFLSFLQRLWEKMFNLRLTSHRWNLFDHKCC